MQWVDRVGRRLKLRDLHILLVVVQRGSMAKAAAELAISQPAVSRAVSDMEHALGRRLLDRGRNGVQPTAYGRALARRGLAIFDEIKQGIEELDFLADPTTGALRIGCTENVAAGLLPAVIDKFAHAYPRIHLEVVQTRIAREQQRIGQDPAGLDYSDLRERRADLLMGRIPRAFAEKDIEASVVFNDQIVVVASRTSKWARARTLTLPDLAGERWVMAPLDTVPGMAAADLFRAGGADFPHAAVTTLSLHLICRLVARGAFVAAIPESILRFEGGELPLKLLSINLPAQPWPVGIVTLKNRTLSPVATLFIEMVHRIGGGSGNKRPASRAERHDGH